MEPMTLDEAIEVAIALAEKTGYSWTIYKREQNFYVGRQEVLRSLISNTRLFIATFSPLD